MLAKPRFLVVTVALAVFAGGTALAAAFGYSWALVLACGLFGAGWVVLLNSPQKMPVLRAAPLSIPLFGGLSAIPAWASVEGDVPFVPWLVLLLAAVLHLLVLAAVRRGAARAGEGGPPVTPAR